MLKGASEEEERDDYRCKKMAESKVTHESALCILLSGPDGRPDHLVQGLNLMESTVFWVVKRQPEI
jgi:hypothetical protein